MTRYIIKLLMQATLFKQAAMVSFTLVAEPLPEDQCECILS